MISPTEHDFAATRNACKLCTPLGACLAFKGVEGAAVVLHGSQGCATYIRRYMISHYREPIDIASSSFSEETAVFGGGSQLAKALDNVIRQYSPAVVGVATTCLSETIGDDVAGFLKRYRLERAGRYLPEIVHVSSASYRGTHADGYTATVRALVDSLARSAERGGHVNLLPGMVSPEDLRYLRETVEDFGFDATILPDYSDTLDGPAWDEYQVIPPGGTPLADIRRAGAARASIEFASVAESNATAGAVLAERFGVPHTRMPWPMGVRLTDEFFDALEALSGKATPVRHARQRGRLIDSMVDAHKHVFGKRAVVFGEEDLVVGLAALLSEAGIVPVLCASGGNTGRLRECIEAFAPDAAGQAKILDDADFEAISRTASGLQPDLIVGHSKGYKLARALGVPLVRVGFPIHDRVGGARVGHLGYLGAQQLLDRITNALLDAKQAASQVGYTYL